MFYSGSTNLKFSKKRNQWENSTQSCRISVNENEKDIYRGYSYGQTIFYYDSNYKSWVFNWAKYSVTTSSHQFILKDFLNKYKGDKKIIVVSAKTLNHGFSFDFLEIISENLGIVERYFPKKLESFKESIAKNERYNKDQKNKRSILNKVSRLDYSTKKGLLKALEKCERDLKHVTIKYINQAEKCLSLGFTPKEILENFDFRKYDSYNVMEYVTIKENKDLEKIYKPEKNKINFWVTSYDWQKIKFENLIKKLESYDLLDQVIKSNFEDTGRDYNDSALGRDILEYQAKKRISDIAE